MPYLININNSINQITEFLAIFTRSRYRQWLIERLRNDAWYRGDEAREPTIIWRVREKTNCKREMLMEKRSLIY